MSTFTSGKRVMRTSDKACGTVLATDLVFGCEGTRVEMVSVEWEHGGRSWLPAEQVQISEFQHAVHLGSPDQPVTSADPADAWVDPTA